MFILDRGVDHNLGFYKLYVISKMVWVLSWEKLIGKVCVNARFSEFFQTSLFIINTHCWVIKLMLDNFELHHFLIRSR